VTNRRDNRYRELLRQLPVAVLVVQRGVIRFANEAATRLLAAESKQLRGHRFNELVLSSAPAPHGGERQTLRRLDGQSVDVETQVSYFRGAMSIVLREPSRAEASEAELRQAQRMESLGRLTSGVAHDFNNVLTAIQGHAEFLLEDMAADDPLRADAQEIARSAERATVLTRQLLSFGRGKAFEPQVLDLNSIIKSMEGLLRRVISENIELTTTLDPALWPVQADASQIEQIIVNLIVNARDAMPGGGTVCIKTGNAELAAGYAFEHEEVVPGPYAMLVISDTGVGMDKEVQAHVFEPFFTTKEPGKGTGLGLSTVRNLVRQLHGHVFLYSEPGHGTVFKIYFPAASTAAESHRSKLTAAESEQSAGETVLIVDDDTAVRALASRVLEARGYRVLAAANGKEAIDQIMAASAPVALALTDHVLPDTTGVALAGLIRERLPEAKLLIMSGYTAEDLGRLGTLPAGAALIEKPFTPAHLARTVREVLNAGKATPRKQPLRGGR